MTTFRILLQPTFTDDKIQPNDRLRIKIANLVGEGLTTTLRSRVDPSGRISLPLVGQVEVGDNVPAEAETAIIKAYRNANLIAHAKVSVEFDEKGAQISIQSGPFQIGDHALLHVENLVGNGVETTKLCVVDANGAIKAPMVGSVKVQGLTEFETEKAIDDTYRSANLLQSAQASVERISAKEAVETKVP